MNSITFIDTETDPVSRKILDIGSVNHNGLTFHQSSADAWVNYLKGSTFICGHNIFSHDLLYTEHLIKEAGVHTDNIIDTLYLSPFFFPPNLIMLW
jgi:ATP-dependent DNA helicase RecQ